MHDLLSNAYPRPIYCNNSNFTEQPYPLFVMMSPYSQSNAPEDVLPIGVVPSFPVKDIRSFSYNPESFSPPTLDITGQVQYIDPNSITPGLLPTSMNPPSSLAPWVTHTTFQSPDYLAHSPAWPMNEVLNCQYPRRDQHVPTRMPELGNESASPASERVDYTRMEVSESPLPKIEQEDSKGPAYQASSVEDDSDNFDPCYAELLRQCLLEAPDHTMSLRDLYAWVAEHSPKAKNPSSTGWKNSVRHNLSRNQGFEKVIDPSAPPSSGQGKSRSLWRLTEKAVTQDIQPTTRYRKGDGKRKSKRSNLHGTADEKRVRSGAKGGQATRRRRVRQSQLDSPHSSHTNTSSVTSPAFPVTDLAVGVSFPYWASMSDIQDPIPCPAPESGIMANGVHNYHLMPEVKGYFHQSLRWN